MLEREEKAAIIDHADMTVLEECDCLLQIGENVPIRTGTVRLGSGREQSSYQDVNTGTIIRLKSKVSGEQVLVELDFSKSAVKPRREQDEVPQGTSQLTHQTTIQIKDGNAMAVGGMMQQSDDQTKGILFIVAAEILESSKVQMMKFQSYSRPPVRAGMAMSPRGRGSSPGRPSQEEMRKRLGSFAETMFARADVDKDGVISQDEMAQLALRNFTGKPPITKDQYVEWVTSKLESGQRSISGRGSPASGFRRPAAPPQASAERATTTKRIRKPSPRRRNKKRAILTSNNERRNKIERAWTRSRVPVVRQSLNKMSQKVRVDRVALNPDHRTIGHIRNSVDILVLLARHRHQHGHILDCFLGDRL